MEMMEIMNTTNWIWLNRWSAADKDEPVLALFRKTLNIEGMPRKASVQISADSRYKLFVNGTLVGAGPSKGDSQVWYMDEADILTCLKEGENVLAAEVLRYPQEHRKGNHSIFRTEYPGIFVKGEVIDNRGTVHNISANKSWKGIKDSGFHIISESPFFAPLQIYENRCGDAGLKGWMLPGYDDSKWNQAVEYLYLSTAVSPGNLLPRSIPYMFREQRRFEEVMAVRQSVYSKVDWEKFLHHDKPIIVPPHTTEIVEISAGEEITGYLHLAVRLGQAACITILQSEGYVQNGNKSGLPVKGNRNDWKQGHLDGFSDYYQAGGYGTEEQAEIYEPFWFRTFRFVRLEIKTSDQPLILSEFYYTLTGYPLEVGTHVQTSDASMEKIWQISERTLRRCMHETYEDCPFYEQLQYTMDSRSQILYTYSVAADDRLARKCMDDFKRSQRYDGLLNCSYPCFGPNVIPGFSIYYIMMLYDHMMYFGDKELLEEHMPTVERILHYFHKNLDDAGYVKKIGGLNMRARFWSFIDWTKEWDDTTGVPAATQKGPITMESLLYIMGLQHAAEIAQYLGRTQMADAYIEEAGYVKASLQKCCMGKKHMLSDGPGIEEYSQHVQVFAVLTDTVTEEQGRKNLEETILHKENYAQCSVAMAFYLFRALQKTGLYSRTQEYWGIWKRMLEKGVTTCVEDEVGERSDCHAWGALILYELPSVVLGVQPAKPGYEAVRIAPETAYFTSARGEVRTPKGIVRIRWNREKEMILEYEVPAELEVEFQTDNRM